MKTPIGATIETAARRECDDDDDEDNDEDAVTITSPPPLLALSLKLIGAISRGASNDAL